MAYNLNNVNLLIVEDMPPMLSLTISMLNIFGFKNVDGAKSAEHGYELFCRNSYDLVVTDWLMEPTDGIELIRMIRKNPGSPNPFVPIILMTGYSDRPRVENARDSGVTEFLVKPYSARDLYARIVQIIEKPRQFVDNGDFFGPDRRRRKNMDFYGLDRRDDADKNAGHSNDPDADVEIILRELRDDTKKI